MRSVLRVERGGGDKGKRDSNSLRISSGCLPLIMLATVLHPTSLQREAGQPFGSVRGESPSWRTDRRGLMSR